MNNKKELKVGLIYTFLDKYCNILVALIIMCVLSRMLSPKEFGIVAIINTFLTFFNTLADVGFGAGIIQRKEINRGLVALNLFIASIGAVLKVLINRKKCLKSLEY